MSYSFKSVPFCLVSWNCESWIHVDLIDHKIWSQFMPAIMLNCENTLDLHSLVTYPARQFSGRQKKRKPSLSLSFFSLVWQCFGQHLISFIFHSLDISHFLICHRQQYLEQIATKNSESKLWLTNAVSPLHNSGITSCCYRMAHKLADNSLAGTHTRHKIHSPRRNTPCKSALKIHFGSVCNKKSGFGECSKRHFVSGVVLEDKEEEGPWAEVCHSSTTKPLTLAPTKFQLMSQFLYWMFFYCSVCLIIILGQILS